MYDIIAPHLSDAALRNIAEWMLSISAVLMVALAFVVSFDASWRCPLAAIRWGQRYTLGALSVAMAYTAMWMAWTEWTPPGPFLILFVIWTLATIISAVRHLAAPKIDEDNTWSGAWHTLRTQGLQLLQGHGVSGKFHNVR